MRIAPILWLPAAGVRGARRGAALCGALLAQGMLAWLIFCIGLLGVAAPAAAIEGGDATLARNIKAAYLYKFLAYVDWPPAAFPQTDAPYVIGVVGDEAVAGELVRISAGRTVNNRRLVVRQLKPGDPLTGIHMLYIGAGDAARQAQMLKQAQQKPVLTVTDGGDEAPSGSVINFRMIDARIRFDVYLVAAERNDLKLSSRLLSVAHTVHSGAQG